MPHGQKIEKSAQFEVLGVDDIAVQQHNRMPRAFFEVVEADTLYREELPLRWVIMLYLLRPVSIPGSHNRSGRNGDNRSGSRPSSQHAMANLAGEAKFRAIWRQNRRLKAYRTAAWASAAAEWICSPASSAPN
jgi:hypothetical protein